MIKGWIENFIQRWQARCPHDAKYVRADILEGDAGNASVQWCYRCGAYRVMWHGTGTVFRQPQAAWATRTGL